MHRIHAHSYGRQELTSKLFSLFRLWSQAKYAGEFVACMEEIIRAEAERVCSPPPPEEVAASVAFTRAVADVDEEYLARVRKKQCSAGRRAGGRSGVKQSKYRVTLLGYMQLFNAPLTTHVRHYCWDHARGRPCCRSREEMLDKLAEASSRLFLLRRPETPTQKEWTRIRLACVWLLVGMTRSRLLPRGVQLGTQNMKRTSQDPGVPLVAHAVGAGDNDLVRLNASRLEASTQFLNDESTPLLLCSIVLAANTTSTFMYTLLGGSGQHVTAQQLLGVRETRVGKVVEALTVLVEAWTLPIATNPWSVMMCWAPDFGHDERILRVARQMCVSIMAGMFWRFDRYYSDFPYLMHSLLDPGADAEERLVALGREGVGAFDLAGRCCMDWCTRQILLATGSEDELVGPFGLAILRTLFRLIRWGIGKAERLHALHRHWAHWQGGGNRSIVHLSCRHQVYEQWVAFRDLNVDLADGIDNLLVKDADKLKEVAAALRGDGASTVKNGRAGIGGNPKFTMRNAALKAAKEAKGGAKLTVEEVQQIERDALEEYENMRRNPEEYSILYEQYRQEHLKRSQRRLDAEASNADSGPMQADDPLAGLVPIWRHGDRQPHWPVDIQHLDDQLGECSSHLHRSTPCTSTTKSAHITSCRLTSEPRAHLHAIGVGVRGKHHSFVRSATALFVKTLMRSCEHLMVWFVQSGKTEQRQHRYCFVWTELALLLMSFMSAGCLHAWEDAFRPFLFCWRYRFTSLLCRCTWLPLPSQRVGSRRFQPTRHTQ